MTENDLCSSLQFYFTPSSFVNRLICVFTRVVKENCKKILGLSAVKIKKENDNGNRILMRLSVLL